MDPKIVAKLHDAFKKALDDPAVIATLAKYDMVPNYKNTEDYKKFVVEVTESERKVIERSAWRRRRTSRLVPGARSCALGDGHRHRRLSRTSPHSTTQGEGRSESIAS